MGHHHDGPDQSGLTFEEKMGKLIDHWIKHNIDHAKNYRDWAQKAKDAGMAEVAEILEKAARETLLLNQSFDNACDLIAAKLENEKG